MNKGLVARLQLMGSYGFLVSLLVIVVFPFYWMTVTSFKGEDQMRSLVSMFWPSPPVTENYEHLLRKTEFVSWFRNSVFVAISSTFVATAIGTIGAYALARLKFLGRAFMSSAVLITYLCRPPFSSSRSTRRSARWVWPTAWAGSSPPIRPSPFPS